MSDPLNAQTELDAVNAMLASIGSSPVNTLAVPGVASINIAKAALSNTLRSVLLKGWSFNTDYNYDLVPDGNDEILIPDSALWVEPCDSSKDYVVRTQSSIDKLYDRKNHTFKITDNPLKVDIIWAFGFESIPEAARGYVATKAARVFQSQVMGSDILYRFTLNQETEALATLMRLEARTQDVNILSSGHRLLATSQRRFNP